MFKRSWPRQRPRSAIRAETLNTANREAARAGSLGGDPGTVTSHNMSGLGPQLLVKRQDSGLFVRTPANGIPARSGNVPGKADCTVMTWDHTDFQANTQALTVEVRNPWSVKTGNSKTGWATWWCGSLWIMQWEC